DGYCCDISRTWPLVVANNGLIDSEHYQLRLQLYEALIGVQYALIESIEPGHTTLDHLYQHMLALLQQLLAGFGVFEGSVSKTDIQSITNRICPHHASHFLGLDIHDTPSV